MDIYLTIIHIVYNQQHIHQYHNQIFHVNKDRQIVMANIANYFI
jgi:hypothetical protein